MAAQLEGAAVYEIGAAITDVGEDSGEPALTYGLGLGGSYRLFQDRSVGLVLCADLLVRGFGLDVPGRIEEGAGVFDQSDLRLDQFVAAGFQRLVVGAYFEQRRIDRGTPLGKIGFPATGIGLLVRARLDRQERIRMQFTWASFTSGELELQGVESRAPLDTGRSFRISVSAELASRWTVQEEYADARFDFESVSPTLGLFDHRQRAAIPTRTRTGTGSSAAGHAP